MYKKTFHNNRGLPLKRRVLKTVNPALLVKKAGVSVAKETVVARHQFSDFLIADQIKKNIAQKGYTQPTPIQDTVIPVLLEGKDVVGIANTGTGKTAAFLIPLLHKIMSDHSQKLLIVAPTRELAVQIQEECRVFSHGTHIFSALCIGGVSIHGQIQNLKRNPQVVIGTPGRLKDLKNQGKLTIASFNNIVLDEVDRMLDMGFIHDVKFIISHLPKYRQSSFFSATISPQVQNIIQELSQHPVTISIKAQETAVNIDQDIVKINGRAKPEVLYELLVRDECEKVIIFGRTKWGIEKLARHLQEKGLSVVALHGNKNQNQRQRALDMFRNNQAPILLATDIAARGIDVDDVTHVINYELPETYDDYVHRIGRTGRNNKKGIALSFVD